MYNILLQLFGMQLTQKWTVGSPKTQHPSIVISLQMLNRRLSSCKAA